MNKDLYKQIKDELASLEGEWSQPESVRSLLGQKILGKNEEDRFAIICAFYEYMSSKESFSFINSGTWADFFRNNLSKYLTIDRIELIFDDIINNDSLVQTILNVCNDEVKKNFYDYAKKKNTLYLKTGSNKYEKVFNKIEEVLASQGLVKKSKEVPNYESSKELDKRSDEITAQIARLSQEKEKIEADKVSKRDDLFGKAGAVIGVNPDKLIRKVGDENSFAVDRIVLDQRLADKIASNEAIVATQPKNVFDKLKKKALNALMLLTVNLEIVDEKGLNVLRVSKKKSTLDKMASSDNEVLRSIANSVRKKITLFKELVKPSSEVSQSLKAVFKTTNEKFLSSIKDTVSEVKSSYGELRDNLKEVYDEQKNVAKAKTDELVSRISDYGVSTREKMSDKLHEVADRIAPTNPRETVTYITTPDGQTKRLIVRAATKAGQIHSFKEEKARKM